MAANSDDSIQDVVSEQDNRERAQELIEGQVNEIAEVVALVRDKDAGHFSKQTQTVMWTLNHREGYVTSFKRNSLQREVLTTLVEDGYEPGPTELADGLVEYQDFLEETYEWISQQRATLEEQMSRLESRGTAFSYDIEDIESGEPPERRHPEHGELAEQVGLAGTNDLVREIKREGEIVQQLYNQAEPQLVELVDTIGDVVSSVAEEHKILSLDVSDNSEGEETEQWTLKTSPSHNNPDLRVDGENVVRGRGAPANPTVALGTALQNLDAWVEEVNDWLQEQGSHIRVST